MKLPTICLSMIVKNESETIGRCLKSVIKHIDAAAIVDTGSTDDTIEKIRGVFTEDGDRIDPSIMHTHFDNFSQARNEALTFARGIRIKNVGEFISNYTKPDWLLLIDADMVLRCDTDLRSVLQKAIREHDDKPDAYHIIQETEDGLSYPNIRLLRRSADGVYKGSTHEALHLENRLAPVIKGITMFDHFDGGCHGGKFERDVRLLEEDLIKDPSDHRTVFYLAQSYCGRGWPGDDEKAAAFYRARAGMKDSWDEEKWLSRIAEARIYNKLNREGEFIFGMFDAYQMRPHRAEPLYDLAKYFRKKKMPEVARLLAAKGVSLPMPDKEQMFVDTNLYKWAMKEEYVVSAAQSHDHEYRSRGARICNEMALDGSIPREPRYVARNNLLAYAQKLEVHCHSFQRHKINFTPPDGYSCGLPSIITVSEGLFLLAQRCVNYEILIQPDGTPRFRPRGGTAIKSRTFLLELNGYFEVNRQTELHSPHDLPTSSRIQGLEDIRLCMVGDKLHFTGMAMSPEPNELCQQVTGQIIGAFIGEPEITDWRILPSPQKTDEKNWMMFSKGGKLGWIYNCTYSTVLDEKGLIVKQSTPPFCAEVMCGGSGLIKFDGGYLAVIHEHVADATRNNTRAYLHRFVWFNADLELKKCSPPFIVEKKGIEYIAGLASKDDGRNLVISYHIDDVTSWLATLSADDVRKFMGI